MMLFWRPVMWLMVLAAHVHMSSSTRLLAELKLEGMHEPGADDDSPSSSLRNTQLRKGSGTDPPIVKPKEIMRLALETPAPLYGPYPAAPSSPPYAQAPLPFSSPSPSPPTPSPSPSPSPSSGPDTNVTSAPTCPTSSSAAVNCLFVNTTAGTVLDAFGLTAAGWQSGSAAFPGLAYEFGVLEAQGEAAVRRRPWQSYSDSATAIFVGLPAGNTSLYVCVRAAKSAVEAVGPRACTSIAVQVSAQVSAELFETHMSAIENEIASSASAAASTSGVLALAQRLAAMAAASANGSSSSFSRQQDLASTLLDRLLESASSGNTSALSASAVLMVFDGVGTLFSLAGADSRATALNRVAALSDNLATQPLAIEDAEPVAEFFGTVVADAMAVVMGSSSSNSGGGASAISAARAQTARGILGSVVKGSDSLVSGLLNAVGCEGTAVRFATSRLAAAGRCMTATLAASGGLASSAASSSSDRRRHLLASSVSSSAVNVALNPALGQLCATDAACSAAGIRLSISVLTDTFLLITSLGGSAGPLAASLSDYRAGGLVEIISPIARFSASGLPASAIGLAALATFDISVNMTAIASRGATTRRAIVRLQDIGVGTVDASSGMYASPSATRTANMDVIGGGANLVSGYSNALGDFVVVQYESTANLNSGPSLPDTPQTGAAGPARQPPLTLLTAAWAFLAAALLAF